MVQQGWQSYSPTQMENLNVDSKEGKNGDAEAEEEKDKEDGSENPSAEGEVNFCL